METHNNKCNVPERRTIPRRCGVDRRITVRFGDILGRRTGVDRRVAKRAA
jgi:hypothetical protein